MSNKKIGKNKKTINQVKSREKANEKIREYDKIVS